MTTSSASPVARAVVVVGAGVGVRRHVGPVRDLDVDVLLRALGGAAVLGVHVLSFPSRQLPNRNSTPRPNTKSINATSAIMNDTKTRTTMVYVTSCLRVGQMTFRSSATTSRRNRATDPAGSPSSPAGPRGRTWPVPSRRPRAPGRNADLDGRRRCSGRSRPLVRLALLSSRRDPPVVRPAVQRLCRHRWQGRQDLNLQPAVLETAALPIELHP